MLLCCANELFLFDLEAARVHAENAVREEGDSVNYLRLGSRLDATASKLQAAIIQQKISNNMKEIVKNMERALREMNILEITDVMDRFEHYFERLDVRAATVQNAMESTSTTSTPSNLVDRLMKQIADEAGIEMQQAIPRAVEEPLTPVASCEEDLAKRLAEIRNKWS